MAVAGVLGWTLAAASALTSVPQTVRLLRTRATGGLALATELAWTTSWAMWLWYSLSIAAAPKASAETVGLVGELALTGLLVATLARRGQLRTQLRGALVLTVFGTVAALAVRGLAGLEAYAAALAVYDGVSLFPALRATVTAPSLAGLSLPTWLLKVAVALGWIGYGLAIGHPLAAGWTLVMAPAAAFIVARIVTDRRRVPVAVAAG